MSLEQRRLDRAEQVEHLRRKIAAVSGKVGDGRRGPAPSIDPLPDSESLLPLPESLAELLPASLPRGTVAVLSGARSLSLSMVAAVTAEGGHAAIVGQPDVTLLAAVEMGADLSRIAVIPEPGADPVEVAAVLMDGMDSGGARPGWAVGASQAGRGRGGPGTAEGRTPLVTGGDWQGRPLGWRPGSAAEVTGAGWGPPARRGTARPPRVWADQPGAAGHVGQGRSFGTVRAVGG
jgi:hypothetical protein